MRQLEYNIQRYINSYNSMYIIEDRSLDIIREIELNGLRRLDRFMKPTIINCMIFKTILLSKNELLNYGRR